MPSVGLKNMTVFTKDQNADTGLLMPKLKYRFRINFTGFGVSEGKTELTKQVIDFSRPDVSFDDITIDVYNSKVKLAGKPAWGDITVNLRDDAAGNVTKLIGEQLQRQFDFAEQASAGAGLDYKFTMECDILDGNNGGAGEPIVLEQWQLYGCFIQSADYGDLAYSDSQPVTIALTIRFDNAVQADAEGVGIDAMTRTRDAATG